MSSDDVGSYEFKRSSCEMQMEECSADLARSTAYGSADNHNSDHNNKNNNGKSNNNNKNHNNSSNSNNTDTNGINNDNNDNNNDNSPHRRSQGVSDPRHPSLLAS